MQLAFSSIIGQAISSGESVGELFTYDNYFDQWFLFVLIFCIAQAPELVCRDQRYSVLPLYFTRSLHRVDYVLAKLGALATAFFIVLMTADGRALHRRRADEEGRHPGHRRRVAQGPARLSGLPADRRRAWRPSSLAICSFSPRRAYAAIGLLAYVLIYEAVASIIWGVGREAGWEWADKPQLFAPLTSLMGATYWFFGKTPNPNYGFPSTLGAEAYVLSSLACLTVFTGVLLFRYRRMAA